LYELGQMIEQQSDGAVRLTVTSLYSLLYRLEKRGWIQGRWVEKFGQRRCRSIRITTAGRRVLAEQRQGWQRLSQQSIGSLRFAMHDASMNSGSTPTFRRAQGRPEIGRDLFQVRCPARTLGSRFPHAECFWPNLLLEHSTRALLEYVSFGGRRDIFRDSDASRF
jgi:Transcriptional regulator PadR-like family